MKQLRDARGDGLGAAAVPLHGDGPGVGTCAAMALAAGVDMGKVDIRKLQLTLRSDGVYLEDMP